MQKIPHALLPSKTFLFGEYAVLGGGDAIVLATPPFFEIIDLEKKHHDKSIAFDMLNGAQTLSISDSHRFKGLGRSGAECTASWLESAKKESLSSLLKSFYLSKKNLNVTASGADIMCNYLGHCTNFREKSSSKWPFPEIDIGIFSTGISHHTHNSQLYANQNLVRQSEFCIKAWLQKDFSGLIESIKKYQLLMYESNVLLSEVKRVVEKLYMLDGVVLAKGCGALGADIILTLSCISKQSRLIDLTESLGLTKVFMGNYVVPGLKEQWQHCQNSLSIRGKNAK